MTKTITLSVPVKIDGVQTNKLEMRSPRVGDMQAARKAHSDDVDREVFLFANLLNISKEDIALIEWKDYLAIQKAFAELNGTESPLP